MKRRLQAALRALFGPTSASLPADPTVYAAIHRAMHQPVVNPANHTGKPYCVMCCGCGKLLLKDLTLVEWTPPNPIPGLITRRRPDFKYFSSRQECDTFLDRIGWYVVPIEQRVGEHNHRCPRCGPPRRDGPVGAYIDAATWSKI